MNMSNLTEHKCAGKCPEFKGEQCNHCLVQQIEKREFELGDFVLPISMHSNEIHLLSEWYIEDLDFRYTTNSGGWGVIVKSCMPAKWRHATAAEIQAGVRLDIKEIPFNNVGDFEAINAAREWLHMNGYSYGSMCMDMPIGILKGKWLIAKWRNLTGKERSQLDGQIISQDFREGPVVIQLKNYKGGAV